MPTATAGHHRRRRATSSPPISKPPVSVPALVSSPYGAGSWRSDEVRFCYVEQVDDKPTCSQLGLIGHVAEAVTARLAGAAPEHLGFGWDCRR